MFSKPEGLQKALSLDVNTESAPRILSTEQHPLHVGIVSESRGCIGRPFFNNMILHSKSECHITVCCILVYFFILL